MAHLKWGAGSDASNAPGRRIESSIAFIFSKEMEQSENLVIKGL